MKKVFIMMSFAIWMTACGEQNSVNPNDTAASRTASSNVPNSGDGFGNTAGTNAGGLNTGGGVSSGGATTVGGNNTGGTNTVVNQGSTSTQSSGNSAWVMTSAMFIATTLPPVSQSAPQNSVPGFGTAVTPCSSPGAIITTYNPTGPVWCAENAGSYPSLCANNSTPQFGIISVCTSCPTGQWTSAQVTVAVKYFAADYTTIRCVQ